MMNGIVGTGGTDETIGASENDDTEANGGKDMVYAAGSIDSADAIDTFSIVLPATSTDNVRVTRTADNGIKIYLLGTRFHSIVIEGFDVNPMDEIVFTLSDGSIEVWGLATIEARSLKSSTNDSVLDITERSELSTADLEFSP